MIHIFMCIGCRQTGTLLSPVAGVTGHDAARTAQMYRGLEIHGVSP